MDYIRQVAPEAEKFAIETGARYNGKVLESEAIEWLMENNPDFLGTANHSGFIDKDFMIPYYKELYDKGCYLVCSAGNKGEYINKLSQGDIWKAVGACIYNNGNPKVEKDYVDGEEMDFVSLHKLKSTYDNKKHTGTSFSYPILIGMLVLVQSFFIKKTGKKLSHEQLNKFVIDNCIDLEEKGHDFKTGHGLFVLPKPNSIDIYKYSEVKMFNDYRDYEKAIDYLAEKKEMDSPDYWKKRIKENNDINLMWFCIKWANAVARN